MVTVLAHVQPDTAIRSKVHPAEGRVVVRLEGERGHGPEVVLFADRAELVRLAETLGALVVELDEQEAALAQRLRAGESAA